MPQLAPESEMPSEEHLKELIRSKNSHLFIAELDNKVIGTLTVANNIHLQEKTSGSRM